MTSTLDNYKNNLKRQLFKMYNQDESEILSEITQYEMKPSLLLMSGGVDSTLIFYELKKGSIPFEVMYIDYGQEAEQEYKYTKKHCEKMRVKLHISKIDDDSVSGDLGEGGERECDESSRIPNRNSVFLSLATSYAIKQGYERVYYGVLGATDPSYCDCQPMFVHHFNILNMVSDLKTVQIRTPLIEKNKEEVIDDLLKLGVSLTDCWSCETNEDDPCGKCTSCITRKDSENEYKYNLNYKLRQVNASLNTYTERYY